ncbi:hypothetical protein Tco_1115043, partial [Tanacetum coccineum]
MQAEGLKLLFRMGKDFEQEIHVKLNPMMLTRPQFVLLNEKEVMLIWRSLLEDLWKVLCIYRFVFVASLNLIWHECSIVMSSLSET